MKWLVLLIGGALLFWWLEHMAYGVTAVPVGELPNDAVYVEDTVVAGVTAHVYSTPRGFYIVAPVGGVTRTFGPLSNLDVTRLLQIRQALSGGS